MLEHKKMQFGRVTSVKRAKETLAEPAEHHKKVVRYWNFSPDGPEQVRSAKCDSE